MYTTASEVWVRPGCARSATARTARGQPPSRHDCPPKRHLGGCEGLPHEDGPGTFCQDRNLSDFAYFVLRGPHPQPHEASCLCPPTPPQRGPAQPRGRRRLTLTCSVPSLNSSSKARSEARKRSRQRLGAAGGPGVGRAPSCRQTQPCGSGSPRQPGAVPTCPAPPGPARPLPLAAAAAYSG